jgi:hypothetical protein
VTINGEQVVLDSDSDSDSEELEELDFSAFKSTVRNPTSGGFRSSASLRGTPATRAQTKDNGLRKPPTIGSTAKPTLSRLVRDAKKDAEAQKRIAAGLVDLDKPVEDTPPPDLFGEAALPAIPGGSEDADHKRKRLALAIQRTNALGVNAVYHFFGENGQADSIREAHFPMQTLPKHGWTENFKGMAEIVQNM